MAMVLRITGRTKPGRRDDLLALFEEHLAPRAVANTSQRLVLWNAAMDDPNGFELIEMYDDPAIADENAQADWFAAYLGATMPLLDGGPSMQRFEPRWSTGIA